MLVCDWQGQQMRLIADCMCCSGVQLLSDLRAAVGGGKDKGITSPPSEGALYIPYISEVTPVLVPTNDNSLVFNRNTSEVLAIVYGGSAATPGAFFPNGMNGLIK